MNVCTYNKFVKEYNTIILRIKDSEKCHINVYKNNAFY